MPRIAVVGAGIAGLAAAWELEQHGADVVVFEAAPAVGGKLRASMVDGLAFPLDEGADAFLARVPDALTLCDELGIDDLSHPATGQAFVYARGTLHALPKGQLLGIPTDLDELATSGLLSDVGMKAALADLEADWAPPTSDLSVGDLVRTRLGDEVCDHLVEPLLGGINGGEADGLSTAATAPQIWACAQQGGSLVAAAARMRAAAVATNDHVFATPTDGMATLPARLAEALRAEVRTSTPVTSLVLDGGRVVVDGERFDGVVIAAPAHAAGPLLAAALPDAAARLTAIEFASVVMVTLVAPTGRVDHPLDGSGFVAARTAGTSITACSWGSSKWSHWDDGEHVVFRVSVGHDGDPTDWCGYDDQTLTNVALGDLRTTMDLDLTAADLAGVRVGRWAQSFPQYRPGHLGRVTDIHAAADATGVIALAGASLEGIGVPACIRQGRQAARRLLG